MKEASSAEEIAEAKLFPGLTSITENTPVHYILEFADYKQVDEVYEMKMSRRMGKINGKNFFLNRPGARLIPRAVMNARKMDY